MDEIRSSDEVFFPAGLGDLLIPIIAGELPESPLAIG